MRFYKNPKWMRRFYPEAIWDFSFQGENAIYLTFDDGPHPETTPAILSLLAKYQIKATFFCLGVQTEKHPDLVQQIRAAGHQIGNHGYQHLKGTKTNRTVYLENAKKGAEINQTKLFRPPYGKMSKPQYKDLVAEGYHIIMWSSLSYDFDATLSSQKRIKKMKAQTAKGSIFVFHDSPKAIEMVKSDLPELIEFWRAKEFTFKTVLIE